MLSHSLRLAAPCLAATLVVAVVSARPSGAAPPQPDDRTIVHVLNRIGFGPRPGDIQRVRAIGLEKYIEQQLRPEQIDDSAAASRLESLATVRMSSRELATAYFEPAQTARRARQRSVAPAGDPPMMEAPDRAGREVAAARTVLAELQQQKLLRAIHSERQLEEVMVDFWFNHFNVFAGKGQTRVYVTEYERDTIRPRALGTFRDLLGAVAESPAMLFYLDNWQSTVPEETRRAAPRGRPAPARRSGLNENYARELLELHTLGVDAGYTQQDVQEVARAFTGWTIAQPRLGGPFVFNRRLHDDREKTIMGQRLPAGGGQRDGERVLDMLAKHPATAKLIATKLARRFIADDPPRAVVDRLAARFSATGGDIREVLRALFASGEFRDPAAHRAKIKTPFEFIVSAVRALDGDAGTALPLVQATRQLGMPLYLCQPPTGYSDRTEAWVNTGALLNRMNFALALAGGRMRAIRTSTAPPRGELRAGPGATAVRDTLVRDVMAGDVSASTIATASKAADASQAAALLLGSPDFQKR